MFISHIYKPLPRKMFRIPFVVDQIGGNDFNLNSHGWLKSDISQLLEAQSLQIRDNILSRLITLKASFPAGTSDADMLKVLIPRYCQSYAERSKFFELLKQTNPELFGELKESELPDVEDVSSDVENEN